MTQGRASVIFNDLLLQWKRHHRRAGAHSWCLPNTNRAVDDQVDCNVLRFLHISHSDLNHLCTRAFHDAVFIQWVSSVPSCWKFYKLKQQGGWSAELECGFLQKCWFHWLFLSKLSAYSSCSNNDGYATRGSVSGQQRESHWH